MKTNKIYFMLIIVLAGCSSIPFAFVRSADPALPIQDQAVLAETGTVRIYDIDNSSAMANGIHYFIIPPGRHSITVQSWSYGYAVTDIINIYYYFEPGHYYTSSSITNDVMETAAITITDETDSEWWVANKEAFYARNASYIKAGKGKSNTRTME
jgi:hypothetical protein